MTITEKSFILVQEDTNILVVDSYLEELLSGKMQPILWHRMGMFQVVQIEVLMNILDQRDIYVAGGRKGKCDLRIDWKQAFPFPDGRAAAILAGLDY